MGRERNIQARVTAKCTVDGVPVEIGSVVTVDSDTLRNLVAKGRLKPEPATPQEPETIKAPKAKK